MDETTAETTHDLLLALAGQVDDDLLSWARELVAVDEVRHAMELLTASLVAERVELPGPTRAALVAVGRSVRTELDADAALPPDRVARDTPHRFDGGPAAEVRDALQALPARLLLDCQVSLARRLTPAGSASGPLPHPVVLVEVTAGARNRDVLAYQLSDALDRAGVRASIEVLTAGSELPAYHAEALRRSQPVRSGERGDTSRSNGSSNGSVDPARSGAAAAVTAAADRPAIGRMGAGTPAAGSSRLPVERTAGTDIDSAPGTDKPAATDPRSTTPPPRPVPVRLPGRSALGEPPPKAVSSDDRDRGDGPVEFSGQEFPAPRPEPRRLPDPAPRPSAQAGPGHTGPFQSSPARNTPAQAGSAQTGSAQTGGRPSPTQSGSFQPTPAQSGPHPYREGSAASNVRSIVPPGGSTAERRADEQQHPQRDERSDPAEPPAPRPEEPQPTPVGEELTQLVPPRHRYLIERSDRDEVADPAGERPASSPPPTNTEPLTVRSSGSRDRTRPMNPEDELAELTPQELLRPESVARLSASGRELLARLQAEMQGGGPTLGQRAGGLTANGGGNGHNGGPNGTGPHRRVDPPDLAG